MGADYEGIELGLGEGLLVKAIAQSTGRSIKSVRDSLSVVGDVGKVAEQCRTSQPLMFKPKALTCEGVCKVLKEIALLKGPESQTLKINKIKTMLVACQGKEAKYLIRCCEGKLRIGLAEKTVLVALAHAFAQHTNYNLELAKSIVKTAYSELPSHELIVNSLFAFGIAALPFNCKMQPGVPVKPMLARPTKSIREVLDRLDKKFTCEFKYDGERLQIHRFDDKCLVFSRNSENLSAKYPDVVALMPPGNYVLDCEAVAWNNGILPFQVLSTRKKKNVTDVQVQVCLFAFDLLYFDDILIRHPFLERRTLLHDRFNQIEGKFMFAESIDSENANDIQRFLELSLKAHCEGLMVKSLGSDSTYEPSRRSHKWLKVKKDYMDTLGDSLDLCVIGGYFGRGKRTNVYGGFLLACYDDVAEEYQTICKIGTGFSDEFLKEAALYFEEYIITAPKSYYNVGDATADVWFDAVRVWEVKAADLSISPIYRAGYSVLDKGISLRFPRFIRERKDKSADEATTARQVADMYLAQS